MFVENTEELAQSKLLLLFIIDKSITPLTNEELTEFILEKNYMNYFLTQQYLSELVETNFIEYCECEKENKKVYKILDKGKTTLYYFEDRLPISIKNEISIKFKQTKAEEKLASEIIGDYFKKDNGQYVVNLKLIENTETLFSLYLNVSTEKQAQKFCEIWRTNTEYIYINIFNMLAGENIISTEK